MEKSRLRVLISAYACDPDKGSECHVGWNIPVQIAGSHEVWLVTRANNRDVIEARLLRQPVPTLHVVYYDLPRWLSFWKKRQRGIHLYYYLWQVGIYLLARRLHREVKFDVLHHLTFGIDWIPSFLALLPVPFVWGPLVGARSANKKFRQTFTPNARFKESFREWIRFLSLADPVLRFLARRTTVAVASGAEAREHLLRLGCKTVVVQPSVGMSGHEIAELSALASANGRGPVRFLCLGNLLEFKGFGLVVKAFAEVHAKVANTELWIIGDGPQRRQLMDEAEHLQVSDAIRFWGTMPRREVLSRFSECHVLVHPCLRGAISMACLEAMAAGMPVICLDLGGPAQQISPDTGIKISPDSPRQLVRELATSMNYLATNSEERGRMGAAAKARVRNQFSWEANASRISRLYGQAVAAGKHPA